MSSSTPSELPPAPSPADLTAGETASFALMPLDGTRSAADAGSGPDGKHAKLLNWKRPFEPVMLAADISLSQVILDERRADDLALGHRDGSLAY
jgi:hypothetical protein